MNRYQSKALGPIPGRTACLPDWSTAPKGWQGSVRPARQRLRAPAIAALLVVLVVLAGCSKPADEARLRDTIAAMQAAAEARQPGEVVSSVSEDFSGSHDLDRERLRRLLQVQMLRSRSVGVTLGPLDVEIDGEHATVRFVALTTGGTGSWLPDRARGYRVVSRWRVEDGQWRVFEANWQPDATD